jgi:predicted dienelactone hydrolase
MPGFSHIKSIPAAFAVVLLLAFSAVSAFASGASPSLPNPGFLSVGLWDEENDMRLDIAVWYPTQRAMQDIHLKGWSFRAGKDGTPIPGLYPIILLSHNAASSRLASHDLAAHLARHGFIIIAPTHPKDNVADTSGFFHAANFAERPNHLVRALERVSAVPSIAAVMDRNRVGVLGVGSGAATALQLAGAVPDLSRLSGYCPKDILLDPLCSNWGRAFHPTMQKEFFRLLLQNSSAFSASIEKVAAPLTPAEMAAAVTVPPRPAVESASAEQPSAADATLDIVDPAEPKKAPAGPKTLAGEKQPILAVGLLTPGWVGLFPDTALHAVSAQVGIFAAGKDTVYASAKATERLQTALPHSPASRVLPNDNFFDVQAPCPPAYMDTFPALCGEQTPGATSARKIRNDFFTRFYQKSLGPPLPPPPPPAFISPRKTGLPHLLRGDF